MNEIFVKPLSIIMLGRTATSYKGPEADETSWKKLFLSNSNIENNMKATPDQIRS
jgi:hypothetical protein